MTDTDTAEQLLARLNREIQTSHKYRGLDLPLETLRDLLDQELIKGRRGGDAVQAVREKLHNIIAPYLGDPDYAAARDQIEAAFLSGDPEAIKNVCRGIMEQHASTKERLPLLETFYSQLWAITGRPDSILDLACGLHPFGLPWMNLPVATRYFAYDLHAPRISLINRFLQGMGHEPLARVQDILVNPPDGEADVAFFFKEAHRFEQRQKGCNRPFFEALRVRWLLVSLPAADLSGHHSLVDRQRGLMESILAGSDWPVTEISIGNELVFCIRKA